MMRFLHTRIRVSDLERSVRFYTEHLGFVEVGRSTSPRGNQLAFVRPKEGGPDLELTYFPGTGAFTFPEDIFHIALEVDDLDAEAARLAAAGIPLTDGPHRGSSGGAIAFIDDPDRYEIELIQRAKRTAD